MARFFNTTGPCDPARHYMLPAGRRLPDLRPYIDRHQYFVLHAARQTGKTTAMKARFQVFGMQPLGTTGAEFRRDVEATAPVVERLIRLSGARVE